ncbi:MAG: universal stress protein [Haloplanus sp.]
MTLLVPFDGSDLAEAALVRAAEFGTVLDEDVLAVSVVPDGNETYARERGWIGRNEPFDVFSAVATLHTQAATLCPSADFRHLRADPDAGPEEIGDRIRAVAAREDAAMVFVGSDDAGRVVTGVASVGQHVAADESYDVVVVRQRTPAKVAKLRNTSPLREPKSDFYFPQRTRRDADAE